MLAYAPRISEYKVINRWSLEDNFKCMTFGDLTVPDGPIGYQWVMVFLEELANGELDERLFVTAEFQFADTEDPKRLVLGIFTDTGHQFRGINNKLYEYEYFCKTAFEVGKPMLRHAV